MVQRIADASTDSASARAEGHAAWTLGPVLVFGFGTAVAMWCVWFASHLPQHDLPPTVAGPLLLAVLIAGMVLCGRSAGREHTRGKAGLIGLFAGLTAAVLNLLLLGSKVVPQNTGTPAADFESFATQAPEARTLTDLTPDAWMMVLGFLGLLAVIGLLGGLIGAATVARGSVPLERRVWIGRFAGVVAAAFLPLLLVGGLVTSTKSGMAVPDWPTTYGGNMFLYPIGLMTNPHIFLEHSHRLFGSLVGLCTLTLTLSILFALGRESRRLGWIVIAGAVVLIGVLFSPWVKSHLWAAWIIGLVAAALLGVVGAALRTDPWRAVKVIGLVVFLAVCIQGFIGGLRVDKNSLGYAILHGVTAQLVFAAAVALAGMLVFPKLTAPAGARNDWAGTVAWVTLGSLVFQLVMGAIYRHEKHVHALYTHILFSFVVIALTHLLVFRVRKLARDFAPAASLTSPARIIGIGVLACVGLQFVLGWVVFLVVMKAKQDPTWAEIPTADQIAQAAPVPLIEAVTRTAHQGNGALLLGLVTLTAVLAVRAARGAGKPLAPDAPIAAERPSGTVQAP
jgi:cytochrome c oxidase assembly protein subunit 15